MDANIVNGNTVIVVAGRVSQTTVSIGWIIKGVVEKQVRIRDLFGLDVNVLVVVEPAACYKAQLIVAGDAVVVETERRHIRTTEWCTTHHQVPVCTAIVLNTVGLCTYPHILDFVELNVGIIVSKAA